jgi:hypothetical protein
MIEPMSWFSRAMYWNSSSTRSTGPSYAQSATASSPVRQFGLAERRLTRLSRLVEDRSTCAHGTESGAGSWD